MNIVVFTEQYDGAEGEIMGSDYDRECQKLMDEVDNFVDMDSTLMIIPDHLYDYDNNTGRPN